MKKHIAVLMGGLSKEREVSLSSGVGVSSALKKLGYKVTEVDVGLNVAKDLIKIKPDAAFVALHGTYGEDGCIQGLLELLQIPYTHSGVMASALAMNKPFAKKIFEQEGISVASGKVMPVRKVFQLAKAKKELMKKPYVVKPTNNGSSVGVVIVLEDQKLQLNPKEWDLNGDALVEQFIPGKEISVAVLNGKALGAIEIRPKKGFYDYKAKYTVGKADHIMPAEVNKNVYAKLLDLAERAHNSLGCRGVTRADFRVDDSKGNAKAYILEVNTHPGMTRLSLTPEIAKYKGIDYINLVETITKSATLDNHLE